MKMNFQTLAQTNATQFFVKCPFATPQSKDEHKQEPGAQLDE